MKILLVEDDNEIGSFLKNSLMTENFIVDLARDGNEGSFMARTNQYNVIILDYSLPFKNGSIVCQEIRDAGICTPIIFLTVHNEIRKKVSILNRGADDYITKPFSFEELRARIFAISRRPPKIESLIIIVDDLILDTNKQTAMRGLKQIYLTKKEYNLLEFLMRNKGIVVSRGMIMEHVWNAESDPFSNTVEAHILNLRRKINLRRKMKLIRNIPGRGYTIDT